MFRMLLFIILVSGSSFGCEASRTSPVAETHESVPDEPVGRPKIEAQTFEFEETTYRYVEIEPARIELRWKDDDALIEGPFGSFRAVYDSFEKDQKPQVIMNAGIYEPDYSPTGLHVENGTELVPLNTATGKGNFFLKPNGVFYIKDGKAGIKKTKDYKVKNATWATQSGPLLLWNGKVDRKFSRDHISKKKRNGVCVKKDGTVLLIISRGADAPNMNGFARAMIELGCDDGLYLDGTVSRMYVDGDSLFSDKRAFRYAGFIVVR